MVEHRPFKPRVEGSIPSGLTSQSVSDPIVQRPRTPAFHAGNTGSNPVGVAIFVQRFRAFRSAVAFCARPTCSGAPRTTPRPSTAARWASRCARSPDGAIHEATPQTTAWLVALLTWSGVPGGGLLPIPAQMPRGPYRGQPLRRLELAGKQTDGRDVLGVIGHRDQTGRRGRGDPGDAIWTRLAALGFEGVDYDGLEDLEVGKRRQAALNAAARKTAAAAGIAYQLVVVDGIVGPASIAAARRLGFARWRDVAA